MEEPHRQWEVGEDALLEVLDRTITTMEDAGVPYVVMGGIGSAIHGRPRWTHDIDLLVRPEHARRALTALADAGYEVEEFDPFWLFKAVSEGVLVDVIFRSVGDIYLDDEMLERSRDATFRGQRLRVIPPEDLVVVKAVAHAEHSPRHWHDALAIIAATDLDWEYLVRRSRHGVRRVLSLLLYAQSNDLSVPTSVVRALHDSIDEIREAG